MGNSNLKSMPSFALNDFTQTLRLVSLTFIVGLVVAIVVGGWKLMQNKWKTERELAPFILVKPRHWLLGHMYLVSKNISNIM